jgi:hypothetical protein
VASCREGGRDSPMNRIQVHISRCSRLYHQNLNLERGRISNFRRGVCATHGTG